MLDSDLNWSAHMAYVARKVSWKIAALQRAGQKLNHAAKRQYYLSVIQSDLEYGSNAFFSSLSALAEKKLTGLYKRAIRAVAGLPPWSQVNSLELAKRFSLWPIIKRLKLKLLLFTFRCTHYLSSTLLSSQYNIRSHLNSTHSITRGQTYLSLTIPKVNRRPGSVSPLFVSSLLWNSLPSLLRTRSMSFLQFRRMLFFVYEGSL